MPRKTRSCQTPAVNESTPELCNNAESGLGTRFISSSAGVWQDRVFRGIRDSWQSDEFMFGLGLSLITATNPVYLQANNPVCPGNGTTPAAALAAFLGYVAANTVYAQPGRVAGPPSYNGATMASFTGYFGAEVRVHHVGKGWSAHQDRRKRPLVAY